MVDGLKDILRYGIRCGTLYIFVLVILSFSVFSISILYSGVVTDGATKNGLTFDIGHDGVYVISNSEFVTIGKNECGFLSDKKICVDSVEEADSGYTAKISIYDKKYDFVITRKLGKQVVFYNELVNVTVNISNNGYLDAPLFLYTDTYPIEFDIFSDKYGNVLDNKFRYVGNLSSQKSVIITYSIRPKAKIKAQLRGELSVNDTFFYSDLSLIDTISPVVVLTKKDSRYHKVGDVFNYTVFINNSLNVTTIVNATLFLPNNLQFLDGTYDRKIDFKFTNKSMQNQTMQNKTFVVKCIYTGNEPVVIDASVDNGAQFSIDTTVDYMTVTVDKPILSDNIKTVYTKGEKGNIFVSYKNFGKELSDVTFLVTSDLFSKKEEVLSNFSENNTFVLLDEDVYFSLNSSERYYVNVSYYFYTDYGEQIIDSKLYNFSTSSVSNITISYVISSTVDSLDDVHVAVLLKNNMKAPIENIDVYDEFEQKYFKEGVNINRISLGPEQSKTVYEYVLSTPYVLEQIQKNISTFVKYSFGGRVFFVSSSIQYIIKPRKYGETHFKLSVDKTLDLPSNFSTGDIFYVNYRIENTEINTMKNILFDFPISQEYENIGNTQYYLQKLDPGEIVYFDRVEKLRPTINGSINILPTKVYFQDEYGLKFSSTSNEIKNIVVLTKNEIDGPLLYANNSFISFIDNGAYFELSLFNRGTSPAYVYFSYNNMNGNVRLAPSEKKIIPYTVNFIGNGNFSISDVLAQYEYLRENHTVLSSGRRLEFMNYVPKTKENAIVGETSDVASSISNSDKEEINTQKVAYSSFFVNSWVIITIIIVSVILVIVVFYEIKKHKL